MPMDLEYRNVQQKEERLMLRKGELEKASYEKASHALLYIPKIGQCHQCLESGLDVMVKICL